MQAEPLIPLNSGELPQSKPRFLARLCSGCCSTLAANSHYILAFIDISTIFSLGITNLFSAVNTSFISLYYIEEIFHAIATLGYAIFAFLLFMAIEKKRDTVMSSPLKPDDSSWIDYMRIRTIGFQVAYTWTVMSIMSSMLFNNDCPFWHLFMTYLYPTLLLLFFKCIEQIHYWLQPANKKCFSVTEPSNFFDSRPLDFCFKAPSKFVEDKNRSKIVELSTLQCSALTNLNCVDQSVLQVKSSLTPAVPTLPNTPSSALEPILFQTNRRMLQRCISNISFIEEEKPKPTVANLYKYLESDDEKV